MSIEQDIQLAEFVSANTDPSKSLEIRYLEALRMFANRARELHSALKAVRDNLADDGSALTRVQAIAYADKALQRNPVQ